MPRKVNYGIDYEDDYDDGYDDYYDDFNVDENGEAPVTDSTSTNPAIEPGIWFCSICTYDNDEALSSCDICGAIRTTVGDVNNSSHNKTDNLSSKLSSSASAKNSVQRTQLSADEPDGAVMPKDKYKSLDATVASASKPEKPISTAQALDITSLSIPKERVNIMNESNGSTLNVDKPENRNSSSSNLLNVKADSVKKVVSGKAMSHAHYKPENWMLPVQSENNLTQLNVAVVGHVDSGKSTLSGRLLHLLGQISQKQLHKNEKEAKLKGKGSFSYAWALDETPEERERGITMTVAVAYFESKRYHIVLLDSPGHQDFVPNMISGATQADAAILVVDASSGSFEAGMAISGGQTREHAQLIRSFGVEQIIVAVNKMDAVAYSKERFESIQVQLGSFLRSCGFKDASSFWIPLSAVENQNLVAAASDGSLLSWYQGPHLLDAIDSLQPPTRDVLKPLVMPICDVIKSRSLGQTSACGKLEAGAVQSGMKVLAMPSGNLGTVRSLERDAQPCSIARAGDSVAITLQGIDVSSILAGAVLCHPDFPVATAKHLELKIFILEGASPILIGSQLEFHIHHVKEVVRIVRILSILDQKTGEVIKKAPRCLIAKQSGVVEVVLHEAVCVDEFRNCKALGRVSLRSSGRTVALGIVSRLIDNS